MKVFADKLEETLRQMRKSGMPMDMMDIDPVDAFGGYVAVDKYDTDHMEETQENIQWKTQLEGPLQDVPHREKGVK